MPRLDALLDSSSRELLHSSDADVVIPNYGHLAKVCFWHSLYCKDPVLRGVLRDAGSALEGMADERFDNEVYAELRGIQELFD
jgi:hypothetical protein